MAIGKGRGKGQRRRAKGQAWQGVGWDVKNIMVCGGFDGGGRMPGGVWGLVFVL